MSDAALEKLLAVALWATYTVAFFIVLCDIFCWRP